MRGVNPVIGRLFTRPGADTWTAWADYVIAVADKTA
jgi:hypothetical protein